VSAAATRNGNYASGAIYWLIMEGSILSPNGNSQRWEQ
jgi:hypothetical protein